MILRKPQKQRTGGLSEGFFEKYCNGKGLDIGYGGDLSYTKCSGMGL